MLIALAVCFAAQRLAIRLSRDEVNPVPPEAPGPALPALQAPPIAGTSPLAWTVAAFALLLAAASVLDLPALALPVLAVLLAAGLVVLRWPQSALLLVPAALPVFDLAPWTGRFFWDEFDLLLAVTLALAWLRCPPPPPQPRGPWLLPGLLAVSLLVAAARGLMPLQWPDANSFAHYYSGYNALRIVKGGLWAAAFVALYRRLPQPAPARLALFAAGMAIGLALTLAVVLRERLAFVSLLDFGSDYRVTGPFSAMHTGGATIECYLAVATAFALWLALFPPWPRWRWAAAALLPPAGYGLMVTYSRNGFAALALVLVVLLAAALSRKGATLRQRLAALLAGGLLLAAALPVLLGAFAGARLALTGQDLSTRVAHWQDALALRDDGLATALFGVGLGRFPASHYWGSAEPLKAGAYGLVDVAPGARALRLGPGVPIYVEQIVDIPAPGRLRLTLDARASGPATLGVALCEKWLLTSGRCSTADLALQRDGKGWQKLAATLSTADWPPRRWPASRPLKFTLLHRQGSGSIEVGRVRLLDDQGGDLLANGDFSAGFDRWFTSTDVDPPWHIHSLPVTILFETGWFGALAWGLAWLSAIGHAARRSWHGDTAAAVALAALLAITVSGLLNTLIDAPRMLFLVLVVLWLARAGGAARRDPSTPGALPAAVRRG